MVLDIRSQEEKTNGDSATQISVDEALRSVLEALTCTQIQSLETEAQ